jgi:hypothetical protein
MKNKKSKRKRLEGEDFEEKSQFDGSKEEWLRLVKTIVAMANTKGGKILLKKINIDQSRLDSSRVDDKVNKYIKPRLGGIRSEIQKDSVEIIIPNSSLKPHIFVENGTYPNPKPPPPEKNEFYKGQIWVRHSSKNEIITEDDFERIFQEKLNEFLKRIKLVAKFPLYKKLKLVEDISALPIREVKKGEGLPTIIKREKTDPNKDYPYLTSDLAKRLGKNLAFVTKSVRVLGLKGNKKYHIEIKISKKGRTQKYTRAAYNFLKNYLLKHPKFTPFKKKDEINKKFKNQNAEVKIKKKMERKKGN